jgi:phage-related protein
VTWIVEVLAVAEPELDALPADLRARFERIVGLIQRFGPDQVREPHVKHLEGALWEMRLSGKDGIARALYLTRAGKRLVVVRVFRKKTEKTPRRELELARKRAASLL